ncbi:hypothetical protein ONE63_008832 [Megalurothrips usitatus]|uniref:Uncharacterized protein n=1 Tax=Megalurothrips usitatus TaxID=439358 RepID=A0AAV7XPW8_9NEOP|nr:hypothetical protein ONE63_008832 [Megalurothrips usitatus]
MPYMGEESCHFPDWTAVDNNTRYIDSGAVPAYFDCPPLSNVEMEVFPVITEVVEDATPEVCIDECNQSESDSAVISPVVKLEEKSAADPDVTSLDSQGSVSEPLIPSTEESSTNRNDDDKNLRPSRKAKRNAFDRLSGNQSSKKDEAPPEKKTFRPSQRRSLSIKPRKSLKYKVKKFGRSSLGALQQSTHRMPSTEVVNMTEPEKSAKSVIVAKNIVTILSSPVGKRIGSSNIPAAGALPDTHLGKATNLFNIPVYRAPTTSVLNLNQLGQSKNNGNIEISAVDKNTNIEECAANTNSVIPLLRSTCSQTTVGSFEQGRDMLRILDCDSKLQVFSGIPSYNVLQSITDATLSMMMTNRDMINDIEPTMRDWIIVTCTKFMLGISTEALAVMFELDASECERIVEKTSLFLRKTISLPECQRFVWVLPESVLSGIAEFSDKVIRSN